MNDIACAMAEGQPFILTHFCFKDWILCIFDGAAGVQKNDGGKYIVDDFLHAAGKCIYTAGSRGLYIVTAHTEYVHLLVPGNITLQC